MSDFHAVRQATVDAIRRAATEAIETSGADALFGFGLCTDDDVGSVYHVYATQSWVREREQDYPEIGFISVEWAQTSDDTLFLALSKLFREWASADELEHDRNFDDDRKIRFRTLVEAMKICRDEGLFDVQTLLSIGSTDPDDLMVNLSCDAAHLLNKDEIAAAYCKIMGR